MVTWAAAQESRRWCFHKRSNFETRPQPGRRVGNNKFVLGQSSTGGKNNDLGEKKNHSWAGRECVGRHLEENGSRTGYITSFIINIITITSQCPNPFAAFKINWAGEHPHLRHALPAKPSRHLFTRCIFLWRCLKPSGTWVHTYTPQPPCFLWRSIKHTEWISFYQTWVRSFVNDITAVLLPWLIWLWILKMPSQNLLMLSLLQMLTLKRVLTIV